MIDFNKDKTTYLNKLYKPDKSKKGTVDELMIPLIDEINKKENYFTTSSCSGRISLFTRNDSTKKYDADWIFVSHNKVSLNEIKASLLNLPSSIVFFKQESFILHVCCKTLQDANNLMKLVNESGIKDYGLISSNKRFIVKIVGTEKIDSPIANNKQLLVDENYLNFIISLANKKLETTHKKIKKLYENIKKLIK